jgi:hypothetical protein
LLLSQRIADCIYCQSEVMLIVTSQNFIQFWGTLKWVVQDVTPTSLHCPL